MPEDIVITLPGSSVGTTNELGEVLVQYPGHLWIDENDSLHADIEIYDLEEGKLQNAADDKFVVYYKDGDDLLARLQPGVDGIILKLGKARATFLPQVWEQLPQPHAFMEHLCLKAGLARSAWRDQHPDIFIYQVQSSKEDPDAADS